MKGEGNIWRPRESRSLVLKKPSLSFRLEDHYVDVGGASAVGEKLQLTGKDLQAFIATQQEAQREERRLNREAEKLEPERERQAAETARERERLEAERERQAAETARERERQEAETARERERQEAETTREREHLEAERERHI